MKETQFDNIPSELKDLNQWTLWRYETGADGKPTKIPYVRQGIRASSTDPETWSTFEQCCKNLETGKYDGLFFVLTSDDPYTVVDFDHCINDGGTDPVVLDMIKRLDSYTEVSPSGEGVHVWVRDVDQPLLKHRAGNIEVYDDKRFMTVTGWMGINYWPYKIEARAEEFRDFYKKVFGADDKVQHALAESKKSWGMMPRANLNDDVSFNDDEIIQKAMKAANGQKFKLLFDFGDTSYYANDDSRADQALCDLIAFWTDDPQQIFRIFDRSALSRDKWHRRDYSEMTINNAIDLKRDQSQKSQKTTPTPEKELTQQEKDVINQRAYDLLKNGNLMELWLQTFSKFHFADVGIGEGILLSTMVQSVKNALGLQIKVTGPSGKGKTHAARTALHLLPQKYVQYATFSDKALWYMEGLLPGSTIFSDDVNLSDEQEAMIRRASSRWQQSTPRTVNVRVGGKWTLTEQLLPPRLNWLLTSVQHEGTDQLLNRQLAYEVDEGNDAAFFKFAAAKVKRAELEFPITDDVCVLREAIRIIKETKEGEPRLENVTIPYIDDIEWNDSSRRNYYMFTDLIAGFTMMHFMQRETDDDGRLIATIDDFNAAMHHYFRLAEGQQLHIPSGPSRRLIQFMQDKEAYNEWNAVTVKDIQKGLNISSGRVCQIINELKDTQARFNEETITESECDLDGKRTGRKKKIYWLTTKLLSLENTGAVVRLVKKTK